MALHLSIVYIALLFLGGAAPASAQEAIGYTPLAPIPGTIVDQAGKECAVVEGQPLAPGCKTTLPRYLRGLYTTGIALAAFFAVFSIVRGGFQLLFTDSILGKLEGKGIILRAVGGLIVVYSSWLFMTTINPQLAQDLDLDLRFPRPKIIARDDALFTTFTQKQLESLETSTKETKEKAGKEIAEAKAHLATLRPQLSAARAGNDGEEVLRLETEIGEEERRLARNLGITASADERLTTMKGANAESHSAVQAVLTETTKAGGVVDQIRSTYSEKRTALAGKPDQVIQSHLDEFNDMASMHKGIAFGIIENPPKVVGTKGAVTIKETELTNQVASRIQAIKDERQRQLNALGNLNATLADTPSRQVLRAQLGRIRQAADNQICQIKNLCKQKGYGCKDLEPAAQCTY